MNSLIYNYSGMFNITLIRLYQVKILGDYSNGAPPLPIPNREVKPISADGTAFVGE